MGPAAARYIAVDGVIGVGKTTLIRLLAAHYDAEAIFEPVVENPFLARFYDDRKRFAFQTQLFFLLNRYRQQKEARQPGLFQRVQVCDYLFAKDRLFAHLNLEGDELEMYEQVYSLLDPKLTRPDVVIYLVASMDVILERIKRRGRPFEQEMERSYLEELHQLYYDFFTRYHEAPVLLVHTNRRNFADPVHFGALIEALEEPWQGLKVLAE